MVAKTNSIAALNTAIAKATKDGKVSAAEWKSLETAAKKDGLTISERRVLRAAFQTNPDAFDAKAKAAATEFTKATYTDAFGGAATTTGSAGGLKDPTLTTGAQGTVAHVDGKLFVGGAKAQDVIQGNLGDCYVLSSLAAIAQQRPDLIKKLVRQEADGSFTVTLFRFGKPHEVKVDADFLVNHGGLAYARSATDGELWVSVVEKAVAQELGSYQELGRGGHANDAIAMLTGLPTNFMSVGRMSADEQNALFADLKTGLETKKDVVVVATRSEFDAPQIYREGLVPNHAYSLLGVSERDGVKYVTLRNPWGEIEPGTDKKNDGTFEIPFSKMLQLFGDISATLG